MSRPDQVGVGLSVLMRLFVTCSGSLFGWCLLHRPGVGLLFAVAVSIVLVSAFGKLRKAAYGRQALSGR